MKKIALVLYYYTPYMSGLSEYARSIAEEIAKDKDTQVDVLVSLHDPKISKEEVVNNVNIKRFKPLFSLSKWIFIPSMFSYIFKNRKNYDKFFVFMPFAESGLFPLIVDKNKLYAFYVCDIRVGKGLVSKIVESVLFSSMRVLLNKAKKIVPLSFDYFHASKIYNNKYESKTQELNPTLKMTEEKSYEVDYREKLGISKDTFLIGFLGRIVYEKGVDYLINTIPYLLDKGVKNFKIILGGDYQNVRGGSVFDELKDLIEKYKENIVVTGFIPAEEKISFFKSLDVFILPSIDPLEAFGIVQLESMSQGVPVIASALPGVREIVQKTGYGLLAQVKSSEDLALQISKLYHKEVDLSKNKDNHKQIYNQEIWKENLNKVIL